MKQEYVKIKEDIFSSTTGLLEFFLAGVSISLGCLFVALNYRIFGGMVIFLSIFMFWISANYLNKYFKSLINKI
jgi:hypothetical protein